ncbi:FHA domain protein [Alkalibaculum bacchi]|uniref:FHA domain protein n=1 Tax=Alkalibaculum bacchi TaxID=645887 RepID=A0A366I826_9FIRM|nr:FHA domain-containing protein [Alkalibaculum bacchi]RBP65271.1 FHA domain protein [Alkalibaculum bacchi]
MYEILLRIYDFLGDTYQIIATVFKYLFVIIIYLFIFSIIRMIYLDISYMKGYRRNEDEKVPYLKLMNRREKLNFKTFDTYDLDRNKTIGRSNKNEITIQDPFLSKKHVSFTFEGDQCFVQDLDSTNGTLVNDEKLGDEPVLLQDGDKIHLGQLDFIFVDETEYEDEEE